MWRVLWTCHRFRPDIIHAHLHEGITLGKVASKLFGVPMVADLQGSLTAELLEHKFIPKSSLVMKIMRWLELKINRMPQHLIVSSTHTSKLAATTFGISPYHLTTLMDGVDLDVFSPIDDDVALRLSLGIQAEDKLVVYIGVLTDYQGIDLLLESIPRVLQECPAAKFLIIGYPNEELYREKARALGVEERTCFTGKIPYDEAPRYLSLAQIAVSPKISTTEANLKLFTYMAMGLPTVVFDNPVNREILGDLGVYAKLGDVEDLTKALLTLLSDPASAKELGLQSRQKAIDDYSWLAVGRQLSAIYDAQIENQQQEQRINPGQRWNWLPRFALNRRVGETKIP
jgi:glycosyltransferase involved in cell wall biosynthesis